MRVLVAFLVAALAVGGAAPASASDHDRARRAVEEGRILPLKEILARAQGAYPGQVIEAELEDEDGMRASQSWSEAKAAKRRDAPMAYSPGLSPK